jgi:hypothetical protein
LIALLALAIAAPASLAFAASLGVATASLTSFAAAGAVPTATCSLPAVADTTISGATPIANGAATTLTVANGAKPSRALVRFDVGGCLPTSSKVVSASLRLYLRTAPTASRTDGAYVLSAPWVESTVTFDAQPAAAATATATTATGTTNAATLQWDVAADVQSFADGSAANNGWLVEDTSEGPGTLRTQTFDSREGPQVPVLVVTYWP